MCVNHRAEHDKVIPGHNSMVIGPMVCCQAGSAQVVQQASVHTSEGGTEKLMALCERAMRVNHREEHGKVTPSHISMVIGPKVRCQAGSEQVVEQASVHTSEGGQVVKQASVHTSEVGTEKLLALCERAMRVKSSGGTR